MSTPETPPAPRPPRGPDLGAVLGGLAVAAIGAAVAVHVLFGLSWDWKVWAAGVLLVAGVASCSPRPSRPCAVPATRGPPAGSVHRVTNPNASDAQVEHQADWGRLEDGTPVGRWVLRDGTLEVGLVEHGARLQSVLAPDRDGVRADVVLGFSGLEPYTGKGRSFGATIGRFANRIAGGTFDLDGRR